MKIVKEDKELDLTVILPIHQLDDKIKSLLEKALTSIIKQSILPKELKIIVPTVELEKQIEVICEFILQDKLKYSFILNLEGSDFCTQINVGVSNIETEYFSYLEIDDEYNEIWFKNAKEYIEYYPNIAAFLALGILTDTDSNAKAFINGEPFAQGFSEVRGKLDSQCLSQYPDFMLSGAVIKKESFEEVGGLKKNIKLFFNYEFLLRFVYNDHSTMVIPKLGYKHMMGREDSIFELYKDPVNGLTPQEAKFYLDTAKKEYLFNPNEIKRNIEYIETVTQ